MRRPVSEVREEAQLTISLGAELEELLLAEQVHGKSGGDGIGKLLGGNLIEVFGQVREEDGMAGFVEFDELLLAASGCGEFAVFEVVDLAFEKGIIVEEFGDTENIAADGDDIHAAVFVAFE